MPEYQSGAEAWPGMHTPAKRKKRSPEWLRYRIAVFLAFFFHIRQNMSGIRFSIFDKRCVRMYLFLILLFRGVSIAVRKKECFPRVKTECAQAEIDTFGPTLATYLNASSLSRARM
jgi:hypothetical protein